MAHVEVEKGNESQGRWAAGAKSGQIQRVGPGSAISEKCCSRFSTNALSSPNSELLGQKGIEAPIEFRGRRHRPPINSPK